MNTNVRTLLSASIGLGLAAFSIFSAVAYDLAAIPTVLGVSALIIYGLVEIAILSYAPAPSALVRRRARIIRVENAAVRPAPMPVILAPRRRDLRGTRRTSMAA